MFPSCFPSKETSIGPPGAKLLKLSVHSSRPRNMKDQPVCSHCLVSRLVNVLSVVRGLLTLAVSNTSLNRHVLLVKVGTKRQGFLLARLSIVVASCVNEWVKRREAGR